MFWGYVFVGIVFSLVIVDAILKRVTSKRADRFTHELCIPAVAYELVRENARHQGFHMDAAPYGTRHKLESRFLRWHQRAVRMRCVNCGQRRTFVYSLRTWPAAGSWVE